MTPNRASTGADGAVSAVGSAKQPLLRVRDLTAEFMTADGPVEVLSGVSFDLHEAETLGLVGESGSGKTVTSQAILGLLAMRGGRVTGGSVVFEGVELVGLPERQLRDIRGNHISMIFQEPMSALNPAFTIGEQIAETVKRHRGASRREAWQRAVEMLRLVGVPDPELRVHDYPHMFSGGMRQRAMIAMALACEPKVLIADEPTTALDVTVQAKIMDLLDSLQRRLNLAVILVTHDLLLAAEHCSRLMVMYAGQVVEVSDTERIFERPGHPYTEGLLNAMPQATDRSGRHTPIPGSVPNPARQPPGCRFHPRCPYVKHPLCSTQAVPLVDHSMGLVRCIRADELHLKVPTTLTGGEAQ